MTRSFAAFPGVPTWLQIWTCLDRSPQILLAISHFFCLLRSLMTWWWTSYTELILVFLRFSLVFLGTGISWLHPHFSGFMIFPKLNRAQACLKAVFGTPRAAPMEMVWCDEIYVWYPEKTPHVCICLHVLCHHVLVPILWVLGGSACRYTMVYTYDVITIIGIDIHDSWCWFYWSSLA